MTYAYIGIKYNITSLRAVVAASKKANFELRSTLLTSWQWHFRGHSEVPKYAGVVIGESVSPYLATAQKDPDFSRA